jgi:copper(I)-binding protein
MDLVVSKTKGELPAIKGNIIEAMRKRQGIHVAKHSKVKFKKDGGTF